MKCTREFGSWVSTALVLVVGVIALLFAAPSFAEGGSPTNVTKNAVGLGVPHSSTVGFGFAQDRAQNGASYVDLGFGNVGLNDLVDATRQVFGQRIARRVQQVFDPQHRQGGVCPCGACSKTYRTARSTIFGITYTVRSGGDHGASREN